MKGIYIMTCIVVFHFISNAQKEKTNSQLLPPAAFDKMIVQDITYAIFGEATPVSGIKVDISKPEATISGIFQPKEKSSLIFGFDFKGGITDKNFVVFTGGFRDFNTAFELKPSIHIIPAVNSAKFYTKEKKILLHKNKRIADDTQKLADSFYVTATIFNKHFKVFNELLYDDENLPDSLSKKILIHFIKKSLKNPDLNLNPDATQDELLSVIPEVDTTDMDNTYKDEIRNIYRKYKKLYDKRIDSQDTKQIENVSTAWSKKNYWWFTFSPLGRTEKINEYHTKFKEIDSLYFKSNYHFYYGVNAMVNNYHLYPDKVALFWRAGLGFFHSNNISSLTAFNYETVTPFFTNGNAVTTKNKSGIAYNYDDIRADFTTQISGEIYLLPITSFFPGVYLSGSVNISGLYKLPKIEGRENDKLRLPIEGGLIFNVNSREKDKEKSVLSLSFYCRYEDLTDKIRIPIATGIAETREEFLKRNLSFGLKVGIPITLPQTQR